MDAKVVMDFSKELIDTVFEKTKKKNLDHDSYFLVMSILSACLLSTSIEAIYHNTAGKGVKEWLESLSNIVNKSLVEAYQKKVPIQVGIYVLEKEG